MAPILQHFFRKRKIHWKTDLAIIVLAVAIILIYAVWRPELPTKEMVESWAVSMGTFGPLAVIGVIILETVIAPIPGTIVPIVIGALYGVWPGILYAWIGNIVGSTIAFWIARKLGRPIVTRVVKSHRLEQFDKFLHQNRLMIWIVYVIPVFPIDMTSFVIGMSKITYRRFLSIISIGFTFNLLILTFFGERILSASGFESALYIVGTVILIVIAIIIEKKILKEK